MFVHLHSHLTGSISDSIITPEESVAWARSAGVPAHAVTDHGSLTAVYPFYLAAQGSGVRPIFGIEAYFDAHEPGDTIPRLARTHLILLAKNIRGFRNLVRLNNEAWEKRFRPPRFAMVNWDMLKRYREGLICTTACVGGPVGVCVMNGQYERAEDIYRKLNDLFGENFYPEVAAHPIPDQPPVNRAVLAYARRSGRPPVLTNDCHYPRSNDWFIHNLYIKTSGKTPKSFSYNATCFYLKPAEEMRRTEFPDAFADETLRIAEVCTADEELRARLEKGFAAPKISRALFLSKQVPITPRMAVMDAGRVMRLPDRVLAEAGGLIGGADSLDEALRRSGRLRAFARKFPLVWNGASGLEGLPRYVEPDFSSCVDADDEMLSLLPVRTVEGLTVIDVDAAILGRLGVPVRPATRAERGPTAAVSDFFEGLRRWWNEDAQAALPFFERSVSARGPVEAYFRLADTLASAGKSKLARNVLASLASTHEKVDPALSDRARRVLAALIGANDSGAAGAVRRRGSKSPALPVSIDHLPDFSALYLNGRLGPPEVRRAVELVEELLENDVGVVAVRADAPASRSACFAPLLIGLDAFLRRYRGRIYRVGSGGGQGCPVPTAPVSEISRTEISPWRVGGGPLMDRWFPAFGSVGEVAATIPADLSLKSRRAPELAFRAGPAGRTVRHSQLIRARIRHAVLRDPGMRRWRLPVTDISGDGLVVRAPRTKIVPDRVQVDLELGADVARPAESLAVRVLSGNFWRIDPPETWTIRPMRHGRRKRCRTPARMISCTPGGAPGIHEGLITEISLSGCELEGGGKFAEGESAALMMQDDLVLAVWKLRSRARKSIWAFYDYEPAVRSRLSRKFGLSR
ncbi:PHP domain-containing protein [bacterium]|nr:PHP domain-containing protein [bacterium]